MMRRLQLELNEEQFEVLSELQEICDLKTKKGVFNTAVTLLAWAAAESGHGKVIASLDKQRRKYTEVHMPALEIAKQHADKRYAVAPYGRNRATTLRTLGKLEERTGIPEDTKPDDADEPESLLEKAIINNVFNVILQNGDLVMAKYKKSAVYKNEGGQVSAFGEKARSDHNTFIQQAANSSIDLAELARQLAQVRSEMKKRANGADEHDEAIGAIASAENAAKSGDESKALSYIKGAGTWALKVAESVTASLVKDAIEGKIGVPGA